MTAAPAVVGPPVERTARHRLSRSAGAALLVGGLLLGIAVQLLRSPGVATWRAVFGEDGGIFLTDALNRPTAGTFFLPYQGYLQVVARLLAAVVAVFPVRLAALLLATGAATVVSALALYVYVAGRALLERPWTRAVLAALVVLVPVGYDLNASITNLHWYLDFACFFVFLGPLRRSRDVAAGAVVAALAVLSDPLAGLYLPLAAYRLLQSRRGAPDQRRGVLVVVGVYGLALCGQALTVLTRQSPEPFVAANRGDIPTIYGIRVAGSFLVGDRSLPWLSGVGVVAAGLGSLLVVTVLLVLAARRLRRGGSPRLAVPAIFSVLWLVVPLLLRGSGTLLDVSKVPLPGSRYIVVPTLLLAVAALVAVDRRTDAGPNWGRWPAWVVVAVLAIGVVSSYRLPSQRTNGPVWSSTVQAAEQRCRAGGAVPPVGDVGRTAESPWGLAGRPGHVLIPVAPHFDPPAWSVLVDCHRLD